MISQRCRFEFGGYLLKYQEFKRAQVEKHLQKYAQELQNLKDVRFTS